MRAFRRPSGIVCCFVIAAGVTAAEADESRLSDAALDSITAAGLLFEPSPAFAGIQSQINPGLLQPAPPPPSVIDPPPLFEPPAPPSNQITASEGGATATVILPSNASDVTVDVTAFSGNGLSIAGAYLSGTVDGGYFASGGSAVSVWSR